MLFKIAGFFFAWGFVLIASGAITFLVALLKLVVDEVSK